MIWYKSWISGIQRDESQQSPYFLPLRCSHDPKFVHISIVKVNIDKYFNCSTLSKLTLCVVCDVMSTVLELLRTAVEFLAVILWKTTGWILKQVQKSSASRCLEVSLK